MTDEKFLKRNARKKIVYHFYLCDEEGKVGDVSQKEAKKVKEKRLTADHTDYAD